MKMKSFVNIMLAILMISMPAYGASINLLKDNTETNAPENATIGVHIDGDYYVVQMKGDQVQKIELNGNQTTDFEINTTYAEAYQFVQKYPQLSWLEKIQFLVKKFNIPVGFILNIL